MKHEVTVFKSINSHIPQYFDVEDVLSRIKKGTSKNLINSIRNEVSEEKKEALKKKLLWICFSGKFRKRLNNELIEHSGLMCLDFDKFPDEETMLYWRKKIQERDNFCYALFTSPSGNGLKALYRIPKCNSNIEHNNRFDAIAEYWKDCEYFDYNVKGVVRVCFESYDSDLYINRNSNVYKGIKRREEKQNDQVSPSNVETDTKEIFAKLVIWFEKKFNLAKGNRNTSLFYLTSACRDYGINYQDTLSLVLKYAQEKAEDFDSIKYEIPQICKQSFDRVSQNKQMHSIQTADKPNKQDTSIDFSGSFQFSDNNQVEEAPEPTTPPDDLKKPLGELPNETIFWKWGTTSYKIDFLMLKKFLQDQGFYRYEIDEKNFRFVRVIENTVETQEVRHIKDFLLKCLEHWGKNDVYNMIAENTKIKKEYLNYLDPIDINWNKDTKDCGWSYFRNTAVKVTKDGIKQVSYLDLEGFIWKSQKINRDFNILDFEDCRNCDYATFVGNVCNNDNNRIRSFRSAVGYLIHGHKSKSTVKAVILNDEIIADEAMGGTGKGLTMQIIGTLKNLVIIPGADFDGGKDFAWQRIDFDTDIVVIDDIEKNFKYKKLFTFLTDGWPIRKLYQDEVFMRPEESPKIVISTNYILKGDTDSYERRKFELELYPYYSKSHQPIDDFNREFITEWDSVEFNKCDNFILHSLSFFLANGLIAPKYVNLEYKKLIINTSEDFVAFAKDFLKDNMKFNKHELFQYFVEMHGLKYASFPNQKIFTAWMDYWGRHNGFSYQSRAGAGGMYFQYGTGADLWQKPGKLNSPF